MQIPREGQRVSVHLNLNKSRGDNPASWSVVDREPGETNGRVIFETPCAFLSDCVMKVPTTNAGVDRIKSRRRRRVLARVEGRWYVPNGDPFTEGSLLESVSFNPTIPSPHCYYFHRHDDGERTTRVDSARYAIFLATKQMFCINSRIGK